MYYYLLLLIPVVAFIIYIKKKEKQRESNLIENVNLLCNQYGDYQPDNKILNIQDEAYQVIYFKVPRGAELIINSPRIWEVRSSSGQKLINQAYLNETKIKKIIIVYPEVPPIKRYINENEMVFIKTSLFNNMHVIPFHLLEQLLKELRG